MLPQGTLIDNRYEIVCTLGVGGFGAVYKAFQTQFDRMVAIKTLNTTLLQESEGLLRFEREAKAIHALKHKNIVGFYGYGIWQQAPYMVMELVEGRSLSELLSSTSKIEPKHAAMIIRQVFEGLGCAHAAGVVHRDLKPSNIMLVPSPEGIETVKIIDFGLVKLMPGYGIPGQKLTETGYALGTCHYMAPEQALGGVIDQRADIYAAGCILYQTLSGTLPFEAEDNVALMFNHIVDDPAPLAPILGDHPMGGSLARVVENCMSKDPHDRYQNCDEVVSDLNAVLTGNFKQVKPLAVPAKKRAPSGAAAKRFKLVAPALIGVVVAVASTLYWANEAFHPTNHEKTSSLTLYKKVINERGALKVSDVDLITTVLHLNEADHQLSPLQELTLHDAASASLLDHAYATSDERDRKSALDLANKHLSGGLALHNREPRLQTPPERYRLMVMLGRLGRHDELAAIAEQLIVPPGASPMYERPVPSIMAFACKNLVWNRVRKNQLDEAAKFAKHLQHYALTARDPDPKDLYFAMSVLGDVACLKGQFKDASQYYDEAFQIGESSNLGVAYDTEIWGRSRVALKKHDYKAAQKLAAKNLEIYGTGISPNK